jgi:hypothetical protein
MDQEARELATGVFHKTLEDQKKQVRRLAKSKQKPIPRAADPWNAHQLEPIPGLMSTASVGL